MPSAKPKRSIKLFGTELTESKPKDLAAGPLTAKLDNGTLRYIKMGGVETLRAIAFLVRDENWGTCTPVISNQKIKQTPKSFSVSYDARCGTPGRALEYHADIKASADGRLSFSATATPERDFLTNRTGFIVLHPLNGVAGYPVEIEHVDGTKEKSKFPALIDPVQPFMNVRSLRHKVMPGVFAACRMDGDAFETEDHRNWTDASFKTYVRPLELPWPYTLLKGKSFTQSVTLTFSGKLPKPKPSRGKPVTVSLGRSVGILPDIALAVSAAEAKNADASASLIKQASPSHLLCEIDGRGSDLSGLASLYRTLGQKSGARITLEIILPGKTDPATELSPIAQAVKESGLRPDAVIVSPATDLKAILPGSAGGGGSSLQEIYRAARAAFPDAKLGGGMLSFFTELNRKRPPAELLDFITHTTCPIVHAADDISVMETLEALPHVIRSTRAIIGKTKPYHMGPSTIPARLNPYGASLTDNPGDQRICLAGNDPRHRGLYGAAWTLGFVAPLAYGGVRQVSAGAATGPTGIIYRRLNHPQPCFDDQTSPAVYPLYHVLASLAQARGAKLIGAKVAGDGIAALAYASRRNRTLWLANLTGEKRKVKITGFKRPARLHLLDESSFERATTNAGYFSEPGRALKNLSTVELSPYAVARFTADT
jgi:hypothetical protein